MAQKDIIQETIFNNLIMQKILKFITCLIILTSFSSYGQDIILLKNGEKYFGLIIEQKLGESIRLYRPEELDTIKINLIDIEKLMKEVKSVDEPLASEIIEKPKEVHQTSFYSNLSAYKGWFLKSVGLKYGLMVNPLPRLRLGVGLEYQFFYDHEIIERTFIISTDLSCDFQLNRSKDMSFVFLMSPSYHLPKGRITSESNSIVTGNTGLANGVSFESGLGVRKRFKKKGEILISLTYQGIFSKSYLIYNWPETFYKQHSFSGLRMGCTLSL